MVRTHGLQIGTKYILVRTDGEEIPVKDVTLISSASNMLATLEACRQWISNQKDNVADKDLMLSHINCVILSAKGSL